MSSLPCRIHPVLLSLGLAFAGSSGARAQVLFGGNFGSGTGQVQFSHDVSFTFTSSLSANSGVVVVFNEAVTSDGSRTFISGQLGSSIGLEIGGTPYTRSYTLVDNLASAAGVMTANDTYMFWTLPVAASVGTVMTVKSGTYLFNTTSGVNPQLATLSFTGDMFLASSLGARLSSDVSAVPEPGQTAGLTGAALAALGIWRRWGRRAACVAASRGSRGAV